MKQYNHWRNDSVLSLGVTMSWLIFRQGLQRRCSSRIGYICSIFFVRAYIFFLVWDKSNINCFILCSTTADERDALKTYRRVRRQCVQTKYIIQKDEVTVIIIMGYHNLGRLLRRVTVEKYPIDVYSFLSDSYPKSFPRNAVPWLKLSQFVTEQKQFEADPDLSWNNKTVEHENQWMV